MHILSLALGGCIKAEPVRYGVTEDTGGHITYILGEMEALSRHPGVRMAEIATRLFDRADLGEAHARPREDISERFRITRIATANRGYLCKEALGADRPAFTAALIAELRARPRLPDVIHAHFADAAAVAAAVRDALGIPFIYTAHSLGIDKRAAGLGDDRGLLARIAEENAAIARADAVVGSSRDECERQLLAYPDADIARVERIEPGIDQHGASARDIARARALLAPFLRWPDRPLVLAVARPVRKKNLGALVEAFAVSRLRERANLVLLAGQRDGLLSGEPEAQAVLGELVAAIDAADLYGHVAYPRRHERAEVRGLYALAAQSGGVFVNPALTEPFGLTLLEAAVHGLPVVATRHGGPRDIVRQLGHGLLVDPSRPAEIAGAIETLLGDRDAWARASQAGRRQVADLTWDRYADELVAVALRLAPRARPAAAMAAGRPVLAAAPAPVPPPLAAERRRPDLLLLCDMDNTLTGCARSAALLRRYLDRHPQIALGISTGRSLPEAKRVARQWHLPNPRVWVTGVGTAVFWREAGGWRADAGYAARLGAGWDAEAVSALAAGVPGLEPQGDVDQTPFKRSFFLHDADAPARLKALLERAGLNARVVVSHGNLLDILPPRAGKAGALAHLGRSLGLSGAQIIACGDSGNDRDMLEACAQAVVVANAVDGLDLLAREGRAYGARRPHAGGVLEGLLFYLARRRGMQALAAELAA